MADEWFDEIDLDPATSWLRMGTRALGERPWLVADDRAHIELELKARLLTDRRDEVVAHHGEGWRPAASAVRELIRQEGHQPDRAAADPLVAAAAVVQEDLCLLHDRDGAWHLDAACVCFPSRWRLADKIGLPITVVHAPVGGYAEQLAGRVDRLLDRLGERPVLRRNWFVHPDAALFQPQAPEADPVVPAARALDGLHLRSERQTLRRVEPGWVLFTIRVQHGTLRDVLATPARRERFANHLRDAPADDVAHRGMAPTQVRELLAALS